MDINNMRNIVILKDLPSNVVEEAFVVLKKNQKIKKLEYIENKSERFTTNKQEENDIAIKEAELLISNYINKLENQNLNECKENRSITKKYKRIKIFFILSLAIIIIQTFCVIRF